MNGPRDLVQRLEEKPPLPKGEVNSFPVTA
jgi:hypothetical protein